MTVEEEINQMARKREDSDEMSPRHSHFKSSGNMTLSPEMFEKLYLTPKTAPTGDFRKRFANPTPLGLMGFVISALTFSMIEMGWGGSNSLAGVAGMFFFTGPILLILATIFEWVMGNFFPMLVMGMYAVFWLSFGVIETPAWGIRASYSATGDIVEGGLSVGYNAAIALYLTVWGLWLLTSFIFSLRTNVIFALIFLCGFLSSFVFAASYWKVSTGDHEMAMALQKVGGALFFAVAVLAWYATVVIIAIEMRMTTRLPLGDLSHFWPRSELEFGDIERGE